MILNPFNGPYDEGFAGYMFRCPGCRTFPFADTMVCFHTIRVVPRGEEPCWKFEGSVECPTFSPSILQKGRHWYCGEWVEYCCHFFLKNGIFEFCGDSTHELAGQQQVPAIPWEERE